MADYPKKCFCDQAHHFEDGREVNLFAIFRGRHLNPAQSRAEAAGTVISEEIHLSKEALLSLVSLLQSLIPSMEHAEEADLCAQVAGIAGDLSRVSALARNSSL